VSAEQRAPTPTQDASQVRKKSGRELWEEDQRREQREAEERRRQGVTAPLLMGDTFMCKVGGCGYFSDDGK